QAAPYRYIVSTTVLSGLTVPTRPKLGHEATVATCVTSFVQVSMPPSVKPMNLTLSIAVRNTLTGDSVQCAFAVLAVPVQLHSPCSEGGGGATTGGAESPRQAARASTATTVRTRRVDTEGEHSGEAACREREQLP